METFSLQGCLCGALFRFHATEWTGTPSLANRKAGWKALKKQKECLNPFKFQG